ncbi:MAG: cryptochrome/photolyase family protein [Woeseiaceae bacterium]|nr:cryptochrome/photolyase family protein [Woeseiaceae bacterium]
MSKSKLLIILGDQLFAPAYLPPSADVQVYLAEDYGLCTNVRHHQQKIVFFFAAMRAYADELRDAGFDVTYRSIDDKQQTSYVDDLRHFVDSSDVDGLITFEIEDRDAENMIESFAERMQLSHEVLPSPGFTCSREAFEQYASSHKRLHMADFYKQRRRALELLMDGDKPTGGQWSFDEDNRKKLPKNVEPPVIPPADATPQVTAAKDSVSELFGDHPGSVEDFWWPTTRAQAREWMADFVKSRLDNFGPYEDAMTTRSATVFHSALSPLINVGLLTPDEVISAVMERSGDAPIQSVEGFVRQLIGWREFIRGVYRVKGKEQAERNFWSHKRKLTKAWYDGTTGIPPLDDSIKTADRLAWTHHIPRLMVLGNLMTLCEIEPREAHRWFMEMYIDSADWVMGPNVYGMGIFSDGGIFATKPYICGSNYLKKMSDYGNGDWCDIVDGLYWRFIDKNRDFFGSNPRLSLMPRALDRLKDERRTKIFACAEAFIDEFTA